MDEVLSPCWWPTPAECVKQPLQFGRGSSCFSQSNVKVYHKKNCDKIDGSQGLRSLRCQYDMPRLSTASFKTSEPAMAVRLISEPRIFPCTIEAFRCGPECGRMSVILTLDEDPAPASPEAAYNVARICCRSRHVLDAPSKQIEVTLTKGWSKLSGLSPMKCLGPVTRGGLNWHSF